MSQQPSNVTDLKTYSSLKTVRDFMDDRRTAWEEMHQPIDVEGEEDVHTIYVAVAPHGKGWVAMAMDYSLPMQVGKTQADAVRRMQALAIASDLLVSATIEDEDGWFNEVRYETRTLLFSSKEELEDASIDPDGTMLDEDVLERMRDEVF